MPSTLFNRFYRRIDSMSEREGRIRPVWVVVGLAVGLWATGGSPGFLEVQAQEKSKGSVLSKRVRRTSKRGRRSILGNVSGVTGLMVRVMVLPRSGFRQNPGTLIREPLRSAIPQVASFPRMKICS